MSLCPGAPGLAISGEEAHHASWLLRARRAALVVVGMYAVEGRCTGERPLSFGARPWCDLPAAASNSKLAVCEAQVRVRSVSLGKRLSTLASCARASYRSRSGALSSPSSSPLLTKPTLVPLLDANTPSTTSGSCRTRVPQ